MITSQSTSFPFIHRGIVKNNSDPLRIGRCRIHVPDIHGEYDYDSDLLPWSRPIFPSGTKIPEVDSIVWVLFEDGNKEAPVYISGVVTIKSPIEDSDVDVIYSHGECKISYNKKTGEFFLTNKDTTIYSKEDTIDLRGKNVFVNGKEIGSGGGSGGSGIWEYAVVRVIT